jgi:hypothetical protein
MSGNGFPKPLRNVKKAFAKQAAQRWKNRLILRGFTLATRGGFMKNQLFALLALGGT